MGLVLLQAPAEPVATVEEAQLQTRSENPQETLRLASLVAAATALAEAYCRRRFVTQRWRETLDSFPARAITLEHPPLTSVEAVAYVDPDGVLQTLPAADYVVRTGEEPGEVVPAYGENWPSARSGPDAVRVDFTCGYGGGAAVPDAVRQAVLVTVGALYDDPGSDLPAAARALLGPFRVQRFAG